MAEVSELDLQLKDGAIQSYRAKIKVSFKLEAGDQEHLWWSRTYAYRRRTCSEGPGDSSSECPVQSLAHVA